MISATEDVKQKFIDREEELKELKFFKEEAEEGNGKFVLLEGEAGVGKTRLSYHFGKQCQEDGFVFLRGRCLYHEGTTTYLPFLDAFEGYIEGVETEKEKEQQYGMPMGMAGVVEEDEEDISISIMDQREMFFDKFRRAVKAISSKNPLLVFLDDLQWMDDSSVQLLHYLIRQTYDKRVLIIGAYRPEELISDVVEEYPFEGFLERGSTEGIIHKVKLDRFDRDAISELISNKLNADELPDNFLNMVYHESEGNPYYVIEIINSLISEGMIDPYSFDWNPEEELTGLRIPKTIEDITQRRIERLKTTEKRLLQYAAVIGTEFDFEILESIVRMDVVELLDFIEELEKHGIIHEVTETDREMYRFNHLQTRMIIYKNMGKSRKRVLHQQVGEIMEDYYKEKLSEHYSSLSRHFYEGRDFKKAFDYSIKAAEKAINNFAMEVAAGLFERAVSSMEETDEIKDADEKKKDLLDRLAYIYYEINNWDKSLEVLKKLNQISLDEGNKKMEADSLRNTADVYKEIQEFEKAKENYNKAIQMYKELDDAEGIAKASSGLGHVIWREGDFDGAMELYENSVENAKKVGNKKVLATTYLEMGNICIQKGDGPLAIQYYKRCLPPLKSENAYSQLGRAYNNMGDQYMRMGEYEKAIEYFDKTIESGDKVNNNMIMGYGYLNKAQALAEIGKLDEALQYADKGEHNLKKVRNLVGLAADYRIKGMIYRIDGKYKEAIKYLRKALEILRDLDIPYNTAKSKYELGLVYKDLKNYKEAVRILKETLDIFEVLDSEKDIENTRKVLEMLENPEG